MSEKRAQRLKMPIDGGAGTQFINNFHMYRFCVGREGIYLVTRDSIEFCSFHTQEVRPVGHLDNARSYGGMAVSPDGRWLLLTLRG